MKLPTYMFALASLLGFSYGCQKASSEKMQLCEQHYALCTSARCVPEPNDSNKAICFCDVEEGPSMSTAPCNELKSSTDQNNIRTIYSTFSFKQFNAGLKGLKCPSGTPWTWCLNKPCTVDPSDPKKALCLCDIKRTGEWMTLGGGCDAATCKTGYWSGATLEDNANGSIFLAKALGLAMAPQTWCQ